MANFNQAILKTAGHEGGYVNDPLDRGGETKYGISKRAYPDIDIANLTWPLAREIYQRDYWVRMNLTDIENQDIAEQIFDHGVNAGVARASRLLQDAINLLSDSDGIKSDGIIGAKTILAANQQDSDDLVAVIKGLRFAHYLTIANYRQDQRKYFKGWVRRIDIL